MRFKVRVENTGSQPLTGVAAEVEPGEPIVVVPDKCWHHGKPCRGSFSGSGVPLPDLQPQEWDALIFSAEVPESIYGGTFYVRMKIISDQQGERYDLAEVVVSASKAEEAVLDFARVVRDSLAAGGKAAAVAEKSEALLLGQWPTFTLEHPHGFGRIKQYEDRIDGRPLEVEDLIYERWLQGEVLRLRGQVLARPVDEHVDVDDRVVRQRVELGEPGSRTRLLCYIPRDPEHLFDEGDELEVEAIVLAWGPEGTEKGNWTAAACPSARVVAGRRASSERG